MFMNIFKVSFDINDVSNLVISIGTMKPDSMSPVPISDLAATNPQYWIEKDVQGIDHLCTTQVEGAPLEAVFDDGVSPYMVTGRAFVGVEFWGGHPVHRPPTK